MPEGMQKTLVENNQRWFGDKWRRTRQYWGLALAGEAGEVCNEIKKEIRDNLDKTPEITEEVADTAIFCYLFAETLGVDLDDVIKAKCQKNEIKFANRNK